MSEDPQVSAPVPGDEPDDAPDDEALSWAGDEVPAVGDWRSPQKAVSPSAPKGTPQTTPEVAPLDAHPGAQATEDAPSGVPSDAVSAPRQTPAAVLIFYGFIVGWMSLYALGWGVVAWHAWAVTADPMTTIIYRTILVLMVVAPLLWLVTSIVVNRGRKLIWTSLWLLAGVLLLMPWPYFLMYR